MNTLSKLPPIVETATCKQIIHPWTDSCLIATGDMAYASITGSMRFFLLIHGVQLILKLRQSKGRVDFNFIKSWFRGYGHSILLGSSMGIIFQSMQCFLRKILGRYTYYSISYLPALIAGVGIFCELKSRRKVVINSYASMALEVFQKKLELAGIYKFSKEHQLQAFMVINAFIMYLMVNSTKADARFFWFFKPSTNQIVNASLTTMTESFLKYSATGIAIQFFRTIMTKMKLLKDPKTLMSELFQSRTLSLGGFLGAYVFSYQLIAKILYIVRGHPTKYDSFIAGLCAGYAYKIMSDITIINTSFITLLEILTTMAIDKKLIPDLPYAELSICLYNGIIYHARALEPETCPRLIYNIMATVTSNRSDIIHNNYLKFVNEDKQENLSPLE